MLIVTGTVLVLVTWAACLGVLVLVGLAVAAVTRSGRLGPPDLRRGLWWGLLVVTVAAYLGNLIWPLSSGQMAALIGCLLAVTSVASLVLVRRRGWQGAPRVPGRTWLLGAGLVGALVYLAVAALGPVTNYDSGLYHLGAIRYAAEYATIPGLANLYFPFGYGNAEFPLAALLGNGPWGVEGFRLLNGLVIAGLCLDLIARAAVRRHGPGFYVLAVGAVTVLIPMVALSDYWVTSPSQDSAVFAATVVASAYVADAVRGSRTWVADAAVAGGLGILLVLLRPTMAAYLLVVLVIVVVLRMRRGAGESPRFAAASATVLIAAAVAAVAATARDYLLSGWLQYPLSVWAFDVPWRAPDPAPERIATLGFHRDPTNIYGAADGWGWVIPWLRRLPEQWETGVLVALLVAALVGWGVAARLHVRLRWRAMLVAATPSLVMTAAWWLASPPSFRFAWGPVFTSFTVPIGWILWRVVTSASPAARRRWMILVGAGAALPVLAVTVVSAATRLDVASITDERTWDAGVGIPYAVADVRQVEVVESTLPGGLSVVTPTKSEQCWSVFPLCTPRIAFTVRPRGDSLSDGLLP